MRILFIQPNALSESIGICALSAYLKAHGHHCDLILLTHSDNWIEEAIDFKPDLVGFTLFTGMQDAIYKIVRQLKKALDVPVIVGGPHATFYPHECMQECDHIDMLCRGDGEETLLQLMDALAEKNNYSQIPGLWTRQNGRIIDNGISPLINNVDALPMPDRDLYFRYPFMRDFPMKRFVAGYGCPYNCAFCNQPFFEQEYRKVNPVHKSAFMRFRSVDKVIEEILHVKNTTRLKRVHFSDDLFTVKRDWLKEFTIKYPKKVGLPFSCNLRFDLVNQEVADCLKTSLCYAVAAGVESGNEYLRNVVIGKNVTNQKIIESARLLHDRNIKIYTSNIIGIPGETLENAFETIKINQEIKAECIKINALIPFPKTGIVRYAKDKGYLDKDYNLENLDTGDSLHMHCKTAYANEFKNISCFFKLFVKFPFTLKLFKPLVRWKNNIFFRMLGMLNLFQDINYFKIDIISTARFYFNTIYKDKTAESMHWIPGMKTKEVASEK